jgi:hypothetical protein
MQIKIKPREGLIVRKPNNFSPLSEQGELVYLSGKEGTFWKRRIKCGDVIIDEKKDKIKKQKVKDKDKEINNGN